MSRRWLSNLQTLQPRRAEQAELWRDDVRDIIGLTQRKMAEVLADQKNNFSLLQQKSRFSNRTVEPSHWSQGQLFDCVHTSSWNVFRHHKIFFKILCRYMNQYHSISTPLNQLESVATLSVEGLYTEGRLQPGTPTFLIHYYMLTLSAAFLYLHLGLNAKSVFWKSNETWMILLALPLTFFVYFTCIALFHCCFAEQPALMAKSLGKTARICSVILVWPKANVCLAGRATWIAQSTQRALKNIKHNKA